ncbi:MAG: XRE family transcriptional regulator [Micrococcales bacterium]|nr:XRE family transcriptional regulator [Micrococcales bacterium]
MSTPLDTSTPGFDPLVLGKRIRHLRTAQGKTLANLGAGIGRATSRVSAFENGKQAPSLDLLAAIARELGVSPHELLETAPLNRRDQLEVAWARIQNHPEYGAQRLPTVRLGKTLPDEALEALIGMHQELERVRDERVATPEEARRANAALRLEMRAQDDYFPGLEATAKKLIELADVAPGEAMAHKVLLRLGERLGLTLAFVADLPHSTRSVLDLKHHRLYLPKHANRVTGDHRSALLQALASYVLNHQEPADYKEFLRQRVEANYLAAAVLVPEVAALAHLNAAKAERDLSLEAFRDRFGVSYEMAAHRFANLATRHLGIRVHFMKVQANGVIHKAYENDGLLFPNDPLGAIEGQHACRHLTARTVFAGLEGKGPFSQYTDMPNGTYWDTSHVKDTADGRFSVTVGCRFEDSRFFRGRTTRLREASSCPDPGCCRVPPSLLAGRWDGLAWPAARPHSSVLAAMPSGAFPGVDLTDVYQFLERHTQVS